MLRSICGCEGNMLRWLYSAHEDAVSHDAAHPLKDFVDCALFALDGTLAELSGVEST